MKEIIKILPKDRDGIIVLVSGSRDATEKHVEIIEQTIDKYVLPKLKELYPEANVTLVHGDCRGVDKLCAKIALEKGWEQYAMGITSQEWKRLGKAAGVIRNEEMLKSSRPHFCLAFPLGNSPGTRNCIKK